MLPLSHHCTLAWAWTTTRPPLSSVLWRAFGCVRITFNSYNRFAALFQQASSGRLVRPLKENQSPTFTTFKWINLQSDPESNEIGLFGGRRFIKQMAKKFMRSISVGRLDSLIWLCFYTKEASVPIPTRSRLLYEITWILYQLCHLGPITWADDEQDTHTQLQPVEEEEYTLHSSSVYSWRRPGWFCSESNFKYDHFATKNTNWGAVIAAPADLNNAQLCHRFLVAGSHSEEQCPKGQACRLKSGITGSTVMYDTLLFLAAIRRLWQFNTSEKWTQP